MMDRRESQRRACNAQKGLELLGRRQRERQADEKADQEKHAIAAHSIDRVRKKGSFVKGVFSKMPIFRAPRLWKTKENRTIF